MKVEYIYNIPEPTETHKQLIAIIMYDISSALEDGVNFVTEDSNTLQVGTIKHHEGHIVPPHYHLPIERKIIGTQEVIVIVDGIVNITMYNSTGNPISERTLRSSDVITFVSGGHSVQMITEASFIEVKQGPYTTKEEDKHEFKPKK